MQLDKFNEFTHGFLVFASQMAYVEGAQNTYSILNKINVLYRYIAKNKKSVMISNEINILDAYMELQAFRYNNRLKYSIRNNLIDNDIYIKHLSILDYVDNVLTTVLNEYEDSFEVSFDLIKEEALYFIVLIKSQTKEEQFKIIIVEEYN